MPIDAATSLENLKLERDATALYETLATIEKDERRAAAFRTIASNERRHAEVWAQKLREAGVDVPPPDRRPRPRIRFILLVARLFGTNAVRDLVLALEGDEEELYETQSAPEVRAIAADEREHAEIWRRLGVDATNGASAPPAAVAAAAVDGRSVEAGVERAVDARSPDDIRRRERWHRSGRSGTLRAVVFGVSDGLVSNLSLVMGMAGAATEEPRIVLLAGIAGLIAGSSSMAAGEYISMQSQRELFERQIALERAELEAMPEEEEAELAAIYRAKGFTPEEAARIAHRLFGDREQVLDTLVREELGLDPAELGSPWGAAFGSFAAFAVGAAVPVVPYLFGGGSASFLAALVLSLVALFAVGAGVSVLTGRSTLYSGFRQVGIGAAAAAITYGIGSAVGVAVG